MKPASQPPYGSKGYGRHCDHRATAEAGYGAAMFNLGLVVRDIDQDQARRLWGKAAAVGEVDATRNLGILLKDSDLDQARRWRESRRDRGSRHDRAAGGSPGQAGPDAEERLVPNGYGRVWTASVPLMYHQPLMSSCGIVGPTVPLPQ